MKVNVNGAAVVGVDVVVVVADDDTIQWNTWSNTYNNQIPYIIIENKIELHIKKNADLLEENELLLNAEHIANNYLDRYELLV